MRTTLSLVSLAVALTSCANTTFDAKRSEVVLPLSQAWIEGRVVEYVTTDISEPVMANMMGANYVPRLAAAISSQPGKSLVERVYKFPNQEQISVFQSAPNPVGAGNQDRDYSPLWRVVLVRWRSPEMARELRSEEALLSAQENKYLELEVTDIVVNCPVVRSVSGQALRGVR